MFFKRPKQQSWDELPEEVRDRLTMLDVPGIEDEERLNVLSWVTSKYPGYLPAQLNRALTLLSLGRTDEAEKLSRSLVKTYPKEIGPVAGLAMVLAERGNLQEAEALASRALAEGYRWSPCLGIIGQAREARGDLDGATEAYLAAYELTPHAWNHLQRYCELKRRPYHPPTGEVPDFITQDQLQDLIETIDGSGECDNTLRVSKSWAGSHGVDVIDLYQFLNGYGGFCDCEVCLNVSQVLLSDDDDEEDDA